MWYIHVGTGDHYVKENKAEKDTHHMISLLGGIYKIPISPRVRAELHLSEARERRRCGEKRLT